jgi:phage terminase small subunit
VAGLTQKQQTFVVEYLVDGNATAAAIRAGYSKDTAYSIGPRLLKNVEVKRLLSRERKNQRERTLSSADWVLKGLREQADADVSLLFNSDGSVKKITALPKKITRCIQSIRVINEYDGEGKDRVVIGQSYEYKLCDKQGARVWVGKSQGLFKEKQDPEDPQTKTLAELLKADLEARLTPRKG